MSTIFLLIQLLAFTQRALCYNYPKIWVGGMPPLPTPPPPQMILTVRFIKYVQWNGAYPADQKIIFHDVPFAWVPQGLFFLFLRCVKLKKHLPPDNGNWHFRFDLLSIFPTSYFQFFVTFSFFMFVSHSSRCSVFCSMAIWKLSKNSWQRGCCSPVTLLLEYLK